jgi:hypothetical protein
VKKCFGLEKEDKKMRDKKMGEKKMVSALIFLSPIFLSIGLPGKFFARFAEMKRL